MGKTRGTKGTFHAKMGSIKNRNCMDLTEPEELARIHRRTIQKKIFMTQIITMVDNSPGARHPGVWSEMDFRKYQRTELVEAMKFQLSYFKFLKDDALKVLHSICQQIWKTQQWPQDWKKSIFIPIPKKGNGKEFSNYRKIALISHTSKVMLKILQARLQ